MDVRVLFLQTLDDLKRKIESGSPYKVLRSSFLLRQLLFDAQGPLVHAVNRSHRIKFKFTVNAIPPPVDQHTTFWAHADGFDPATALAGCEPRAVKIDELLATRVLFVGGRFLSAKEVLDHVLYVEGAAHTPRSPNTEAEQLLAAVQAGLTLMGAQALIRLLPPVGRLVLTGLAPLRLAVEQELRQPPRS